MASAATLVLKNASAVNVNYFPIRIQTGDFALYVDRTSGVLAAQSKASLTYSESPVIRKVAGKITYPVLGIDGKLSHTLIGNFNLSIPTVATLAERQELRARMAAMVADAIVTSAVDNGETPW